MPWRPCSIGSRLPTWLPDDAATPQYLGALVKSEIAKWAVPIKASGVNVE